jgi:hypothetical protein
MSGIARPDARPLARLWRRASEVAVLLIVVAILAFVVFIRNGLGRAADLQATMGASPVELTANAADKLAATTAKDGRGYTFEIVQRSTMVQRPGGPPIEVDPKDTRQGPEFAQRYPLATYLESGFVTPDGFFAEIRRGPDDPSVAPDFKEASVELSALVRDGATWRNDGAGWYGTDDPPGIGLDPATAALLPTLLREATGAKEAQPTDGVSARTLDATTKVADVPGIIAVDLAAATEISEPASLAFDDAGRLVSLTISARNTNMTRFDLIVETVITLAYPPDPPALPDPLPAYVAPTPDADKDGES